MRSRYLVFYIIISIVVLFNNAQDLYSLEQIQRSPETLWNPKPSKNFDFPSTVSQQQEEMIRTVIDGVALSQPAELVIDYPADGSIFPPEFVPPRFLWNDPSEAVDSWIIEIAGDDDDDIMFVLTTGDTPPEPDIDPNCISPTNELPNPTPEQASATTWLPSTALWEGIKLASIGKTATLTITGFNSSDPALVLSKGQMTLKTSPDSLGAAIFYRDVPLMPVSSEGGSIKPLADNALSLIKWRLKDVSRLDSRVVLTGIQTCANCHSFSQDGKTMGMDVDGPEGDKGAYAITEVESRTVIEHEDIISWNYSFHDKPKGKKTIGFLSQISPNGRFAMTTLNEALYVENYLDYRFLQVFYPTRGILGYYSSETGEMNALPGADDPEYVHCDPAWSPDGSYLVFARARAKDPYTPEQKPAPYANSPNETPIQYDLCRVPFNNGKGGKAEPIAGASQNGMSNTFPKITPDGKYIIFVKCRNGQLMRPDSRLWIVPATGGEAREMNCNTSLMNSWHSISPNNRWMVFSSKANTPYTQLFLTHLDEFGNDSPAILIPNTTADNRAANIPEFVPLAYDDFTSIEIPDVAYKEHLNMANVLFKQGKLNEALDEFNLALAVNPSDEKIQADIYRTMGVAYYVNGYVEEALTHFGRALDIDPSLAEAYVDRGTLFERLGRTEDAVNAFTQALEINPNHILALTSLATIRLSSRYPELNDLTEARTLATCACEQTYYRDSLPLLILANADAYSGAFESAIEHAEQARYFAEITGNFRIISDIDAHLEAFRAGKPYRM
ncbi:tetratricopeptide repeat protein [Candidatus Latescibacterota bacterium]